MSWRGREVIESKISCRKSLPKKNSRVFFLVGRGGAKLSLFVIFQGCKMQTDIPELNKRPGHLMSMHELKLFAETFRNFLPVNRIDYT